MAVQGSVANGLQTTTVKLMEGTKDARNVNVREPQSLVHPQGGGGSVVVEDVNWNAPARWFAAVTSRTPT
jgi:hypothetical protein